MSGSTKTPHQVTKTLWRGIIAYEDHDVSDHVRAFNEFGKSELVWLLHSKALHSASVRLAEKPDVLFDRTIALMLGGYAIETLLKMVVISEFCDTHGKTLTSNAAKEFLPKTHHLTELARKARLRVNKNDRVLLTRLSRYTIWEGRYPIPLAAQETYSAPAMIAAVAGKFRFGAQPLWPQYKTLYEKLCLLAGRRLLRPRSRLRTNAKGSAPVRGKTKTSAVPAGTRPDRP